MEEAHKEANTAANRWSPSTVSSTQGYKLIIKKVIFPAIKNKPNNNKYSIFSSGSQRLHKLRYM